MIDTQYVETQNAIIMLALMVSNLDLDGFISRIDRAEALGPVLVPTLYREAGKSLNDIKTLASSLRDFQAIAETLKIKQEAQ